MRILAIETSCDETGISILEAKETSKSYNFKVLGNLISSQVKIHREYGGVFPALAKREHIKNLPILFKKILAKTKLEKTKKPFDLIIVTSGPGLEPALWTGIVFAKELSEKYKVPIIPANHMEGHIVSVFAKNTGEFKLEKNKANFPILSLLISGGHTEIVLVKDYGKYKILGETVDDAVGEAYDKVARMLELPYPGGPEISRLAEERRKIILKSFKEPEVGLKASLKSDFGPKSIPIKLPRPMIYTKDFNFSFSGLKTAVLYLIRDLKKANIEIDQNMKSKIALEFENAVSETLVYKTKKALEK